MGTTIRILRIRSAGICSAVLYSTVVLHKFRCIVIERNCGVTEKHTLAYGMEQMVRGEANKMGDETPLSRSIE